MSTGREVRLFPRFGNAGKRVMVGIPALWDSLLVPLNVSAGGVCLALPREPRESTAYDLCLHVGEGVFRGVKGLVVWKLEEDKGRVPADWAADWMVGMVFQLGDRKRSQLRGALEASFLNPLPLP